MSELLEYKCPNCGGSIEFDPSSQQMKCPYCDSEFDAAAVLEELGDKLGEDSIEWGAAKKERIDTDENGDALVTYICNSCGGEIVCDKNTAASSCPFCGNPVVMSQNLSGMLKPDLVLPFKLDKKAAKEALTNYYKGKKLLPDSFSEENRIAEIKGVYVPFWLYSCEADAELRYHATKNRFWSDSKFNYCETSHYRVVRSGTLDFEKVPVDGSSKMADDIMESLEPFDYSSAVDFRTAYLSGFFADKYDLPSEECESRANERIKNSTAAAFAQTVLGYSSVVPEQSSIKVRGGEVRYALLPVWMLTTTFNGRKYTFAMNGQSGKFVGDLPVDRGKYWKYFALISSVSAACVFLVTLLLM